MAAVNADADGFWSAMPNGNRVNNSRQGRALIQSLFPGGSTTSPLSAIRSGVISTASDGTQAYDLQVSVQSGRTLLVNPGSAIIGRSGQGGYLSWELPAARTVTCDTPPATNPRNDIVVFRAYDTQLGDTIPASGSIPGRIEIITGQPGGTPVDPVTWDPFLGHISTWPAAASGGGAGIPLARARVATDGTVTLTDIRRGTAPIGAVRVLLPGDKLTDPSYMPGDLTWYNGLRIWDGTTWRGLTPLEYQTTKWASATGSVFPYTLGSVSIPDPGWPYRLKLDAMLAMTCGTGGGFDFVARDGSASGVNLSGPVSIAPNDGRTGLQPVPYTYAATSDSVLTGARTVYMVIHRWAGAGNNVVITGGLHRLTCEVVPAW